MKLSEILGAAGLFVLVALCLLFVGMIFWTFAKADFLKERANACPVLQQQLLQKMSAIDMCVATGLCTPTLEDFEEAYRLKDRVVAQCKEGS